MGAASDSCAITLGKKRMTFVNLEPNDQETIRLAMVAVAEERVLEEPEFKTRVGVSLERFRAILSRWPDLDDGDDSSDECLAINNTLNEVLNGVGLPR